MNKAAYIISLILLLFTGAGAVYGGWSLMTDPSGSAIRFSLNGLDPTPFPHFLIPGIMLFICMGLISLLGIIAMLLSQPKYALFILAEGILLTCLLLILYTFLEDAHSLQLIIGLTGILLIGCGWILYKAESRKLPV